MSIQSAKNHMHIGGLLVEALNLPKKTIWVELRFAAGEPIEVKCGFHPEEPASLVPVIEQLAQFELKPKDAAPEALGPEQASKE